MSRGAPGRRRGGRAALACALFLLGACDGAFHFGTARDAGMTPMTTEEAGAPDVACTAQTCPWDGQSCTSNCSLSCPAGRTCIGSCGGGCQATCATGSSCVLVAGNGSMVTCQGSSCDITLVEEGSVSCQDGATCTITCTDDCTVTCAAGAQCTAQCPGQPPRSVTGTSEC